MNLIRIFYISKATGTVAQPDILDILEKSRTNNKLLGLSGILCFKNGYFAQILEGEGLNVFATYLKIAQDKRHSDLVIVSVSTTSRRVFEGWAMGCIGSEMTTEIDIEEILKFRNSATERPDSSKLMQRWLKLLESQSGLNPVLTTKPERLLFFQPRCGRINRLPSASASFASSCASKSGTPAGFRVTGLNLPAAR